MAMSRSKQASPFVWILAATLISHSTFLIVTSASFEDQKNFYSPDPHTGSHGSVNCLNPPHDPHTPSTPSHTPTPSTPTYTPTPSHNPSPSHNNNPSPSHNPTPHNPSPSTPSGGGAYHHSPPTSGGSHPSPTPVIVTPTTPSTPTTPTHPFLDPNHPFTATCNYWRNHPSMIWGVLGWWGTLGSAFGGHSIPGFPSSLTLPQALSNTRTDGLGSLYREGTASLLNSMVSNKFPLSTQQVRDSFVEALSSDKAAAAQARVFKLANEGHLNPRP